MICAIDFGCGTLRSLCRAGGAGSRLRRLELRSEYSAVPDTALHRRALGDQGVPYATGEGVLLIVGNDVERTRWLTRIPATPLFPGGRVPRADAPARQLLHVLTGCLLPRVTEAENVCVLISPVAETCGELSLEQAAETSGGVAFLKRLVEMAGYSVIELGAAEAALLSAWPDSQYTGVSIVLGAESSSWCLARRGLVQASGWLPAGGNWVDGEIAKQLRLHIWDADGAAYLDTGRVGAWRRQQSVDIRQPRDEQEHMLSRLILALLQQVAAGVVRQLSETEGLVSPLRPLQVVVSGGFAATSGLPEVLAEQLSVLSGGTQRFLVLRASAPDSAVVRGGLVYGELELRAQLAGAA
jgi:hypothetical protein